MSSIITLRDHLQLVQQSFSNALTQSSPFSPQPPHIKLPLYDHQKSCLEAMKEKEYSLRNGMILQNSSVTTKFYSYFGILGDSAGSGKSLSILGHVSQMLSCERDVPPLHLLHSKSLPFCFSIDSVNSPTPTFNSLLVVPYTLFQQWKTVLTKQTTLKSLLISSTKDVNSIDLVKHIEESHITLVSSSCFPAFMQKTKDYIWRRVFYDEADTIKIPSTCQSPQTLFVWLVSSRYSNLLLHNSCYNSFLIRQLPSSFLDTLDSELKEDLLSRIQYHPNVLFFRTESFTYFKEFLCSTHPLRGNLVIRSQKEFLESSFPRSPLTESIVVCRLSSASSVSYLPSHTLSYLRNSDTKSAIQSLNLSCIHQSQPSETYGECSICFEDSGLYRLHTKCCKKVFCGECILKWLTKSSQCPLCRSVIDPFSLLLESPLDSYSPAILPKPTKFEALIDFLKSHPESKCVLFSRYEYTMAQLDEHSIKAYPLTGTSLSIQKTLERFEKGILQVLLLDSRVAASGLHIKGATDFLSMHRLMPNEKSIFLGKLQSNTPLTLTYFFHETE